MITGSIIQKEPSYDLSLLLRLASPSGKQDKKVRVRARETVLQIDSQDRPSRLEVDPECDIMRILYPSEIPPSVNSLKGSSSILLVLPSASLAQSKEVAGFLAESLGLKKFKILSEDELKVTDLKANDLLLVGLTDKSPLPIEIPEGLVLQEQRFKVDGKDYDRPSDSFFGVFRSSDHEGRVVAVFQPLSDKHAHEVARKITHYGRYSYLVFREGRNEAKGTWPVTGSPLVYEWEEK
jgi:hypothetical protein